jgi:citrate synthase
MKRNILSAVQVARRLGVKPQTVYAYVSRGLLSRTLADDGRTSQFEAAEVDELARRGRPRRGDPRVGAVDVSLATNITEISVNQLRFHGHDAVELAHPHGFEAVAELLWSAALASRASWPELAAPHPLVRRQATLFAADCIGVERFASIAAVLAAAHPLRVDLSASNVMQHARLLIASFAFSLPVLTQPLRRMERPSLARVLWPRLSPLKATPARVQLLDSALVLLCDHELATSTLAARVAASARADPFAVVLSGLGALAGPLHGKAATALHRLLKDAAAESNAEQAAARAVSAGSTFSGFGHPVYRDGDPRASALLDALRGSIKVRTQSVIAAVSDAGLRKTGAGPNVDFALAALAYAMDMPFGATEALFAIARTAGFIAHALEEYGEQALRFRARALFVG